MMRRICRLYPDHGGGESIKAFGVHKKYKDENTLSSTKAQRTGTRNYRSAAISTRMLAVLVAFTATLDPPRPRFIPML